jgi:hypothetical protein
VADLLIIPKQEPAPGFDSGRPIIYSKVCKKMSQICATHSAAVVIAQIITEGANTSAMMTSAQPRQSRSVDLFICFRPVARSDWKALSIGLFALVLPVIFLRIF